MKKNREEFAVTELINKLYYMMEDWIGQYNLQGKEINELEARQEELRQDIACRLGEDGQELMEALADLNLRVETIHDQALFRAAMGLGAQIAQPAAQRADAVRPYSTSR